MRFIFSVVLLFSIWQCQARSKLEEVIKSFESKYGLVLDVPSVLSRHQGYFEIKESSQETDLAKLILQLGIDMSSTDDLRRKEKVKINSPLSIASVLGELLLGARGKTFQEIVAAFGVGKNEKLYENPNLLHKEFGKLLEELTKDVYSSRTIRRRNVGNILSNQQITIANGFFIQNGITLRLNYQSTVARIYKSEISNLDFRQASGRRARDYINNWVEKKTHGKIQQIISEEIPQDRKMIIVNALYFRSMWENPFIKGATTRDHFYPDGISSKAIFNVPMMTVTGVFPYYDSRDYACRIIGLPYKKNAAIMYIILPDDSNRKRVHELHTKLNASIIEEWIKRTKRKSMMVSIPRMHLSSSTNLRQSMERKGISTLFDPKNCDLSLMTTNNYLQHISPRADSVKVKPAKHETNRIQRAVGTTVHRTSLVEEIEQSSSPDMFVDDILHTVELTINEAGTEGAAATATVLGRSDFDEDFHVNVPFLLLVRHTKTRLPMFFGSVFDPTS